LDIIDWRIMAILEEEETGVLQEEDHKIIINSASS
jgi:hypothetical protein